MNDLYRIQECIRSYHKISIVDAMSSFGSVPIAIADAGIDYLITSANKCLHGVPGVAIIFARKAHLDTCQHCAVSLSLDLYEQYRSMEETQGAFRFTSPTHVMLALQEALTTLITNGGIPARRKRYMHVQKELHDSMTKYGFHTLVEPDVQSCVITTYLCPKGFDFTHFYNFFKAHGFLLYAGKLPGIDAFRIGNIGEISDADILHFKKVLRMYMEENR